MRVRITVHNRAQNSTDNLLSYPVVKVQIWGPGTLKNLEPYCKLKGPLSTCLYH